MRVLHAGCGREPLPAGAFDGYEEVRLDIDRRVEPHIVAALTDMGDIGEFDAVYCSHTLEHLYPHQVPIALAEFLRVLKPGGRAIIVVPDVENLKLSDEVMYTTTDGLEVTAFDLFYGHRRLIEQNPFMAHHCAFTAKLLTDVMRFSGFSVSQATSDTNWNLVAIGVKEGRKTE